MLEMVAGHEVNVQLIQRGDSEVLDNAVAVTFIGDETPHLKGKTLIFGELTVGEIDGEDQLLNYHAYFQDESDEFYVNNLEISEKVVSEIIMSAVKSAVEESEK